MRAVGTRPMTHSSQTVSSPLSLPGKVLAWDTSQTTGHVPTPRRREGSRFARDASNGRGPIAETMSLLFAAIGAVVTALAEVTFGIYDAVGSATPHLVLVGGVIWTIAAGIERGITWAFVGGLVLDSLLGRTLGISSFALLLAVGGAALIAQPFPRLRLVAPVVAVPIMSLVYS